MVINGIQSYVTIFNNFSRDASELVARSFVCQILKRLLLVVALRD